MASADDERLSVGGAAVALIEIGGSASFEEGEGGVGGGVTGARMGGIEAAHRVVDVGGRHEITGNDLREF